MGFAWWRCFCGTLQIILDRGRTPTGFRPSGYDGLPLFLFVLDRFIVRELTAKNPLVEFDVIFKKPQPSR